MVNLTTTVAITFTGSESYENLRRTLSGADLCNVFTVGLVVKASVNFNVEFSMLLTVLTMRFREETT